MKIRNFITTEGSVLTNFSSNQSFYFLKNDPMRNKLWKTKKKNTSKNSITKFEIFKNRFLKN